MDRCNAQRVRAAIAALVIAGGCVATAAAQPSIDTGEPGPDANSLLVSKLRQTIVDVSYDRVEFDDVIDGLRKEHAMNIHVAWRVLEDRGLRRDQRIELELDRVSLATLLHILLREVDTSRIDMAYHVEDGVVVISSRDDLARSTILRAYDITDLIESGYAIRRFANTPVLALEVTGREMIGSERRPRGYGGGRGGGGSGGGSVFGDPGADAANRLERLEAFVDLVSSNIEIQSWFRNGGDTGSITVLNTVLLIRHTSNVHEQIEVFLDLVRRIRPVSLDAEAVVVRVRSDRASAWRDLGGDGFPRVSADRFSALLDPEAGGEILFRAVSSGFNGRRVWFSALTQRDALTGMTSVVGDQINAFSPKTGFTTAGLELLALPLVAPGGENMILDVQMAWMPDAEVLERAVTLAEGEAKGSIDLVAREMRTVSTSLALTVGDAIALSIPARIDNAGRAVQWEDWLLVRVSHPRTASTR